jgi:general secretion pathway protein C
MSVTPRPSPPYALAVDAAAVPRGDWTRLFGPPVVAEEVVEAATQGDGRFKLVGVVAGRGNADAGQAVAVIAVDGKPPLAYRVGGVVSGDWVLLAVRARGAELGPAGGAAAVKLELAPLAAAATGTLPGVAPSPGAPTLPPPVPAAADANAPSEQPQPPPPGQVPQPGNVVPQVQPQPGSAPRD